MSLCLEKEICVLHQLLLTSAGLSCHLAFKAMLLSIYYLLCGQALWRAERLPWLFAHTPE